MKIIDYGLVCRTRETDFTKDINELIAAGYQPYGSPWSAFINEVEYFYQAMVKYDD